MSHRLPTLDLPVHPTMRHPLTGEPLRAIYVRRDGRAQYPIMGGAPDDGGGGDDQGDQGEGGAGGDAGAGEKPGRDLGFPPNTRVAEMTPEQQAAYWRHQSQKHEGRYKTLAGDRTFDDVRKDLDELAELRRAQQTPAEQALTEAREAGKAEARRESSEKAATAIFRAQLMAQEHAEDDIDELVANLAVANFIGDDGDVDTTKLANFAKRFIKADTANDRRRDFGGGPRREGAPERGSAGKAEAQRRFKKP